MRYSRFDVIENVSLHRDSDGVVRGTATFARAGVQKYYQPDGSVVREFRPPEEVRKSAKEFVNRPITLQHPPDLLDQELLESYIKGLTGQTNYTDQQIKGGVNLFSEEAIKAAHTTHQQLSCGYECDIEATSGTWIDELGIQGPPGVEYGYDQIQRNIEGNHLAIVKKARAGEVATFDEEIQQDSSHSSVGVHTRFDSAVSFDNNKSKEDLMNTTSHPNSHEEHLVSMDMGNGVQMKVPQKVKEMYDRGDMMLRKDMETMDMGDGKSVMVPKEVKDMYNRGDMWLRKDMETMDMGDGNSVMVPSKAASAIRKMKEHAEKLKESKSDSDQQLKAKQDELTRQAKSSVSLDAYNQEKQQRQQEAARADAAEAALNEERNKRNDTGNEDRLEKELTARLDAYEQCKQFLDKRPVFEAKKTAVDWKKEAIKAKTPKVDVDNLSAEEINTRFDQLQQIFSDYPQRSREQEEAMRTADRTLTEATTANPKRNQQESQSLPQDYRGLIHV